MPDYQSEYRIDCDTVHSVVRLTVTAENVTQEMAEGIYRHLLEVTSEGGPYAAIFDLSATKHTTIPTDAVRSWGRHRRPAIPMGACPHCGETRKQVVVGTEPHIFGLARVFASCADAIGTEFQVVKTLEEAFEMVHEKPENFNECVLVGELA